MASATRWLDEHSDGLATLEFVSRPSKCRIVGCKDPRATNYDPAATARGPCNFAVSQISAEVFGAAAGCKVSLVRGSSELVCPGHRGCRS
eukprot:5829453-Prymnesium_polylepis.1